MRPDADDTLKQTNAIGMAIPLLDTLAIDAKTITADALLTQRKLAAYLHGRNAHYVFTVKDNQPTLLADLRLAFAQRGAPAFEHGPEYAHGRIETRRIWTTTTLNHYLDFPHVGQAFCIERHVVHKRSGKTTTEVNGTNLCRFHQRTMRLAAAGRAAFASSYGRSTAPAHVPRTGAWSSVQMCCFVAFAGAARCALV